MSSTTTGPCGPSGAWFTMKPLARGVRAPAITNYLAKKKKKKRKEKKVNEFYLFSLVDEKKMNIQCKD